MWVDVGNTVIAIMRLTVSFGTLPNFRKTCAYPMDTAYLLLRRSTCALGRLSPRPLASPTVSVPVRYLRYPYTMVALSPTSCVHDLGLVGPGLGSFYSTIPPMDKPMLYVHWSYVFLLLLENQNCKQRNIQKAVSSDSQLFNTLNMAASRVSLTASVV